MVCATYHAGRSLLAHAMRTGFLCRLGKRLRDVKARKSKRASSPSSGLRCALAERGATKLAAELAEVYPPLTAKLAVLAARVAANDAAVERVNSNCPTVRSGSRRQN
jgi:hypothetical protein